MTRKVIRRGWGNFCNMEWFVLALLSAACIGIADIYLKKALFRQHSLEFLLSITFIVLLMLLPFIPQMNFDWSISLYFLMLIKVVCVSIAWLLFVKAARHMELSQVAPMRTLTTLYVFILAFVFLGERWTPSNFGGAVLLIAGTTLLETDKDIFHIIKRFKILPKRYLAYIFTALLFTAFSILLDKIILKQADVLTFFFVDYALVFSSYFLISSFLYGGYQDLLSTLKKSWKYIIGFSIATLVGDYLYFTTVANPEVLISLVTPILSLGSLFSVIMGGRLFHEHNLGVRTISCCVMIFGVVLLLW